MTPTVRAAQSSLRCVIAAGEIHRACVNMRHDFAGARTGPLVAPDRSRAMSWLKSTSPKVDQPVGRPYAVSVEEDLQLLEHKLNALKLDYERYFLGTRPREPVMSRAEVQKIIVLYSNQPIPNTAQRFKFNSINSRYQAYKRQWDNILRQMEAGTYKRDVFKANIRDKERGQDTPPKPGASAERGARSKSAGNELFESYVNAAQACGQKVAGLTPKKLQAVVDKQTKMLQSKLGCKDVSFRVVVQDGKVKLKAGAVRD
jgi:hypothetical protein